MAGMDENGNPIHYGGYFDSGAHKNPESLKRATENTSNPLFWQHYEEPKKPRDVRLPLWISIIAMTIGFLLGDVIVWLFGKM